MKNYENIQISLSELEKDVDYVSGFIATDITEQWCRVMKNHGITQEQLAKKAGVSQAYISRLLSDGSNMSLTTIAKIAIALDLAVVAPVFREKVDTEKSFLFAPTDYRFQELDSQNIFTPGNSVPHRQVPVIHIYRYDHIAEEISMKDVSQSSYKSPLSCQDEKDVDHDGTPLFGTPQEIAAA